MNYDLHIQKYQGQSVLFAPRPDREYLRGQCVQHICYYCTDNGKPMAWADAKDWWNHPSLTGAFTFVANNPNDFNQVPARGNIIIWSGALPNSGGAGHVAIFDRVAGAGVFVSFDSNWGGKTCHFVTHNWNNVIGWMVPKSSAPPQGGDMSLTTQADLDFIYQTNLGRSRGAGEGEDVYLNKDYKFVDMDVWNSKEAAQRRAAKQAQLDNLSAAINQLNAQLAAITLQGDATKADLQNAIARSIDLTAQLETAHDKIAELEQNPGVDEETAVKGFFARLVDALYKIVRKG